MPANLLILPLLGGFWFVSFCHYTRFRAQRLDGYRLLLECAVAGAVLIIFARAVILMSLGFTWGRSIEITWQRFAPQLNFSGTAAVAFLIGIVLPFVVNFFVDVEKARTRAIARHGDALRRLIHFAPQLERPVSLTLDNRKVYIGYISDAPSLSPHESYIGIVPLLSGYRDPDTMDLRFTSDYTAVYKSENVDPDSFRVALPLSSVTMASYFDPEVYPRFLIESPDSPENEIEAEGGSHAGMPPS